MKKVFQVSLFSVLLLLPEVGFASLRLNEIMYDLPGPDKTEAGDSREWVEIFNDGPGPITLSGGSGVGSWKFLDSSGSHLLAKASLTGSMTIPAGGYAILAGDAPTFLKEHPNLSGTVIDTVMNLKNSQEIIKLRDGEGNIASEAFWVSTLGGAGNGKTLEFAAGSWREGLRDGGSPGEENSIENVILPEAPTPMPIPSPSPSPLVPSKVEGSPTPSPSPLPTETPTPLLVINEFLPNPVGEDATLEWIELKNESGSSVNLEGWTLETESAKRSFRLSGKLEAGSYLLLPRTETKLGLRNTDDAIFLEKPGGEIVFEIRYSEEIPEGFSAARFGSGWRLTKNPTPGKLNILEDDSSPALVLAESLSRNNFGREENPALKNQAGARRRIPWILGLGLLLGGAAAGLALFLKRRMLV